MSPRWAAQIEAPRRELLAYNFTTSSESEQHWTRDSCGRNISC